MPTTAANINVFFILLIGCFLVFHGLLMKRSRPHWLELHFKRDQSTSYAIQVNCSDTLMANSVSNYELASCYCIMVSTPVPEKKPI
jgi:hypothetical protein